MCISTISMLSESKCKGSVFTLTVTRYMTIRFTVSLIIDTLNRESLLAHLGIMHIVILGKDIKIDIHYINYYIYYVYNSIHVTLTIKYILHKDRYNNKHYLPLSTYILTYYIHY